MTEAKLTKRFGVIAIEKGFITREQIINAMAMQIVDEVEGAKAKNLGSILSAMGYMSDEQIAEVFEAMGVSVH